MYLVDARYKPQVSTKTWRTENRHRKSSGQNKSAGPPEPALPRLREGAGDNQAWNIIYVGSATEGLE